MDNATDSGEKLAFARCFIEISSLKVLPESVSLELEDGEMVNIPVEYEWLPPLCTKCKTFGHVVAQCPTIRIWQQKENRNPVADIGTIEAHSSTVTHEVLTSSAGDSQQIMENKTTGMHLGPVLSRDAKTVQYQNICPASHTASPVQNHHISPDTGSVPNWVTYAHTVKEVDPIPCPPFCPHSGGETRYHEHNLPPYEQELISTLEYVSK